MNKKQRNKILAMYMGGKTDPALNDIIKGWLSGGMNEVALDEALGMYFNQNVSYRQPTATTYRNLRKLQKVLGISKREMATTPLSKRTLFRAAAVLLPVMAIAGAAFYFLSPSPQQTYIVAEDVTEIRIPEAEVEIPVSREEPEATVAVQTPVVRQAKPAPKPQRTSKSVRVSAPAGSHRHVKLADNSTVLLNGGGNLTYSEEKREAYLEGEAFFSVEKGQPLPFRILTDGLTVHVTGTQLNVHAVPGNDRMVVELIEGSVKVDTGYGEIELHPMEELTFSKSIGLAKVGRSSGNRWWDEPLSFEAKTVKEILEYLEGFYGVRINGKDQIDNPVEYTIKFSKMSPIEHIMDIMKEVCHGLEYTNDPDGLTVTVEAPE